MKKLRQIITDVKARIAEPSGDLTDMLWQLICYSPKMSLRLQQEQLLNEATRFSLKVNDEHFAKRGLTFNGFIWGSGTHKVLITHGWGSKAADFSELITALQEVNDLQIIAFDAPGNGSSEGELSNLLLYIQAVKAVISNYGEPDIMIGHSLGGMANMMALGELQIAPKLLISIAPLIKLKENFEATMNAVGAPKAEQDGFFTDFDFKFGKPASYFDLIDKYPLNAELKHYLAYDEHDLTSPYSYIKEFLDIHPSVQSKNYDGVGHERIIKSPEPINDLISLVKKAVGPR